MKTQVAKNFPVLLTNNAATGAAGSDLIMTAHGDCGGATNGTLILVVDNAASSDIANVEVWTSRASSFATSGTALAAVASDSTRMVTVTSDSGSFVAKLSAGTAMSDITVSSGTIANLTQDGVYFIACRDLSRYINVQYDSDGTGSVITAVFIAEDLPEAPFAGARTAY